MVIDAAITVTLSKVGTSDAKLTESLSPPRHQITLPLNGINNYFESCEIALNHHTKLDCDR